MQSDELKSCPFCGGAPKFDNTGSGQCVRIYCVGPDCAPYPNVTKYGNGDAFDRAAKAWNTRASTPLEGMYSGWEAEAKPVAGGLVKLCAKLRKMHDRDGYPDRLVNPDGPAAADALEALGWGWRRMRRRLSDCGRRWQA